MSLGAADGRVLCCWARSPFTMWMQARLLGMKVSSTVPFGWAALALGMANHGHMLMSEHAGMSASVLRNTDWFPLHMQVRSALVLVQLLASCSAFLCWHTTCTS